MQFAAKLRKALEATALIKPAPFLVGGPRALSHRKLGQAGG